MLRQKLAKKLILAKSEMVRKTLLRENQSQADEKLALAIKEICYAAWTTEPTKAQSAACALQSLVKFNPNNEIKAFSFWVSGIAEITKGKLESAIKNLDKSADIFRSINKEHEAAQTQNSKIYALALIGSYDEAIEIGKNILKVFEKYGDEFTAGKIEHNIGNIFYRRDYYKQAQQYYEVARKRYSKLNDQKHIIMVENSLAVVLALQNDFGKAEKLYQKTLKRAKAEEMFVTQAEIEASMGNLAFFRGKLDQALNFLELSRQKYENLKMPHQSSVAELEIANIYLELNLAEEAFSIYEKVTKELHTLKMQSEEAQARANFGRVAALLNETNIAKDELKKSARLYVAEKNKIGAAVVKLTQANLELNSQKYKNALILVKEAENLLENSGNIRHILTAKWLEGETLRHLGKYETAENLLEKTFAEAVKQEQKKIAQISLNSLGKIALQTGDTSKAERHFKKAIELIEKLRAPLPAEEFRMAFWRTNLRHLKI